MDRGQSFLRAWTLLAVFMLLSSMLAWSAIAARPVLAGDPADPAKTTITAADPSFTAGGSTSITVQLNDSAGNPVESGGTDVVTLNSSIGTISDLTDNGDSTWSATLSSTEAGTALVTGQVNTADISDDASVMVTHAAASKLVVTQDPSPTYTADANITVKVEVRDQYDNLVNDGTGSAASVSLALNPNPTGATLLGGSTTAGGGLATFTLNVRKVGTGYGLDASSSGLAGDSTTGFNITHAAASKLVFSTQPVDATADDTFTVKVDVQDAYDNLVDDSAASIDLSLTGDTTSFVGTHPKNASGGTATFSGLQIHLAGTGYQFHASSLSLTGADSDTFDIAHGAPTHLVVTQDPNVTYTADNDITVKVEVRDQYENVVTDGTGSNASIDLTLTNAGTATLDGSPATAVNGKATFTLNVRKVGSGYGLDATSGTLTGDSTTTFNITPGALASFTVKSASGTNIANQTAGAFFTVKATAFDAWGNVKTNYGGGATITGDLGKALGTLSNSSDDTDPGYSSFSTWVNGVATATVTGYLAETGTTITVKDGTNQGTSNSFDVIAGDASTIVYSVANNDRADPFSFAPINTKVSTTIYSACAPSGVLTPPCANLAASTPSTSVRTLVRDSWGNRVPGASVTINRTGSATPLSTKTTDADGVADFLETMSIGTVGDYTLTARVATGINHPTIGKLISIVNELTACDNQLCQNNTNNAGGTKLQKSFGRIVTATDFFTGATTNVLLSTQFTDGAQGNQTACGNTGANKSIGNAVDMLVSGPGTAGTAPNSTMVLVMPKDTLKAFGITARGTATFNICLGAKWIGTGSPPTDGWKARDVNSKKGGLIATHVGSEGRYWGSPADCGTPNLGTDPCIGLRTKQASVAQAYLHMSNADFALLGIKDADLVVIIEKHSPWDGKGTLY